MKQTACVLFFLAAVVAPGQQQQPATGTPPPAASSTPRGFGELFNQAPPHVDQALRARVTEFYQLHQDKKFRQADKLVHEDSKDIFFEGDKNSFRSFKIVGVTFEENYTRAKVVVDIDTDFFFPGFGQMQVNRPLTSMWKLDQNQWWWYALPCDPNVGKDSPFNNMFKGCGTEKVEGPKTSNSGPTIGAPQSLEDFQRALADLRAKVTADKSEVMLPSHEPAEAEIVISNAWDNPVHLTIDAPDLPGLSLRLDKPVLEAGQKARLKIISKPESKGFKPGITARLTVEEVSKVMPIQINFAQPPNREAKPGTYIGPNPPPNK